ncbi:MAG: nucleotidyltransferase family protein [Rhizobiaceae bacterium]
MAAGRSTRMGEVNKLTKVWEGRPLVAHVAEAARSSSLAEVLVVTGHQRETVIEHLNPDDITVHNPDFATGMASSLRAGVQRAAEKGADAALILLGDMPLVTAEHIEAFIAAFRAAGEGNEKAPIVQASCRGKPGNPVLFPGRLFPDLLTLEGDTGARDLIKRHADNRLLLEIGEAAARDFDTPQAFDGESVDEA